MMAYSNHRLEIGGMFFKLYRKKSIHGYLIYLKKGLLAPTPFLRV
jgi:hypothetical protein